MKFLGLASLFLFGVTAAQNNVYRMKPVNVIQARAQSDKPVWSNTLQTFVSRFGSNDQTRYVAALDSVNTASVEGALLFVQAEGINELARNNSNCERRSSINYVVFYNITFAQTNFTLAEFQDRTSAYPEYGPFVAMDSGACTPLEGENFPPECKQFQGIDGQPNVGSYVGGEDRSTDGRAPYPGAVWYSFPNSCPYEQWMDKTPECRQRYPGGLCPRGTIPDGVRCTYAYEIIGWVNIDDLVGITALSSNTTGLPYKNYTEFCRDGQSEFQADLDSATNNFTNVRSLPFWENPSDLQANANRTAQMLDLYSFMLTGTSTTGNTWTVTVPDEDLERMKPLTTVAQLTAKNPACYFNAKRCAENANGCQRTGYSQICQLCEAKSPTCQVAPANFAFPTLERASRTVEDSELVSGGKDESGTEASEDSSASIHAMSFTAIALAFGAYYL